MSPASWSFVLPDAKRGRSLAIIYATVALNAAMIGLVFPILPRLIREVTHSPDVAPYVGWMAVLYAVMQFVFAPVLGTLSDRLGRRPVLLVSLAGAAINYVVMALAPQFWMLRLGRAVAGLTSANMSVATAYITDITPGEQRARRLGLMGTMFGAGFVIGPVLGGGSANNGVRLPFVAAAAFDAGNLPLALFALPESHTPSSFAPIDLAALNPLRPLRRMVSMPSLLPLVSAAQQGQLQGLRPSSVSLASIVAPLGFSGFYFVVQRQWLGVVWLAVAAVNLLAVPFVLLGTARRRAVGKGPDDLPHQATV